MAIVLTEVDTGQNILPVLFDFFLTKPYKLEAGIWPILKIRELKSLAVADYL